jgi:hypothetical protein
LSTAIFVVRFAWDGFASRGFNDDSDKVRLGISGGDACPYTAVNPIRILITSVI